MISVVVVPRQRLLQTFCSVDLCRSFSSVDLRLIMELKMKKILILLIFFVIIELLFASQTFGKNESENKSSDSLISGPNVCVRLRELANKTITIDNSVPYYEIKKNKNCGKFCHSRDLCAFVIN